MDSHGNEVEASSFSCSPELVVHFSDTFEEDDIIRGEPGVALSPPGQCRVFPQMALSSQQARRESKRPFIIPLELDSEERPTLDAFGNALVSRQSQLMESTPSQALTESNRRSLQIRSRYVPVAGSKINSILTSIPVYITARDTTQSLASTMSEFLVVGGPPKRIFLRSDAQGLHSEATDAIAPLPFTFQSRHDVEIHFVDAYGHECTMRKVKNIDIKVTYELRYKLDDDDTEEEVVEMTLFTKKSVKDGMTRASLNFAKISEEMKDKLGPDLVDGYEIELVVHGSYTIDGVKTVMTPAKIPCKYKKFNIVTALSPSVRLQRYHGDMMDRLEQFDPHVHFPENTVVCGQEFGIDLYVSTEDEAPPDIPVGDFTLTITTQGGRHCSGERGVNVDDIQQSAQIREDGVVVYSPIVLKTSGKYKFRFQYVENRFKITSNKMLPESILTVSGAWIHPSFTYVLTDLLSVQVGEEITVECLAGVGVEVVPTEEARRALSNICVTNSRTGSPADRLIGTDLDFLLLDEYRNRAVFSGNCMLVCSLSCSRQNLAPDHPALPKLAVAHSTDLQDQFPSSVVGIRISQEMFRFSSISLSPCGVPCEDSHIVLDGPMQLAFTLHDKNPIDRGGSRRDGICDVMSWKCSFDFTSDQGRALKERQYKDALQPHMNALEQLRDELRGLEEELLQQQAGLDQQLHEAPVGGIVRNITSSQMAHSDVR